MAAGHIVNGQCVDVAASLDYFWGSHLATKETIGSNDYFFTYSKEIGVWKQKLYSFSGSTTFSLANTRTVPTVTFGTCEYNPPSTIIYGLPDGFDYTMLGALFAFSFSVVVALFFIGRSGGAIINIFKPH